MNRRYTARIPVWAKKKLLNNMPKYCNAWDDWRKTDLAFIVEGFNPQKREIMLNAYRKQASKYEIVCGSTKQKGRVIDSLHLHKIIKSLSESESYGFSDITVDKLVCMAEVLKNKISRWRACRCYAWISNTSKIRLFRNFCELKYSRPEGDDPCDPLLPSV